MKDLAEAKMILGWEITREKGILKIDQKEYIRDLLVSEGMISCHATVISVKVGSTLVLDQVEDHHQVDLSKYQRLIDKLMYLSCGTCPDIVFGVEQLSRHNSDPRARYIRIAKQVPQYLKVMITLGIEWGRNPADHRSGGKYSKYGIIRYAKSSYTGDIDDRKLITGYCFFLGVGIINWYSKQQRTDSTSTFEAKYMVMNHRVRDDICI